MDNSVSLLGDEDSSVADKGYTGDRPQPDTKPAGWDHAEDDDDDDDDSSKASEDDVSQSDSITLGLGDSSAIPTNKGMLNVIKLQGLPGKGPPWKADENQLFERRLAVQILILSLFFEFFLFWSIFFLLFFFAFFPSIGKCTFARRTGCFSRRLGSVHRSSYR